MGFAEQMKRKSMQLFFLLALCAMTGEAGKTEICKPGAWVPQIDDQIECIESIYGYKKAIPRGTKYTIVHVDDSPIVTLKSHITGKVFKQFVPNLEKTFKPVRTRRRLSASQILACRQHHSSPVLERLVSEVRAEHQ